MPHTDHTALFPWCLVIDSSLGFGFRHYFPRFLSFRSRQTTQHLDLLQTTTTKMQTVVHIHALRKKKHKTPLSSLFSERWKQEKKKVMHPLHAQHNFGAAAVFLTNEQKIQARKRASSEVGGGKGLTFCRAGNLEV